MLGDTDIAREAVSLSNGGGPVAPLRSRGALALLARSSDRYPHSVNPADLTVTDVPGGVRLQLRVIPRSPKTIVGGVREGRLIVRVTAPPVDDAANRAVIDALAERFRLPRRSIRIVSGATARNKTVEITGVTANAIRALAAV